MPSKKTLHLRRQNASRIYKNELEFEANRKEILKRKEQEKKAREYAMNDFAKTDNGKAELGMGLSLGKASKFTKQEFNPNRKRVTVSKFKFEKPNKPKTYKQYSKT